MIVNRIVLTALLLVLVSSRVCLPEDKEAKILKAEKAGTGALSFSSDGKRLVTGGSLRNYSYLWDVRTAKPIARLVGCGDLMQTATFSRNGRLAVTAGLDIDKSCWRIVIWNGLTGQRITELPVNMGWSAAISPDGTVLVVAALGTRLRAYQLPTGEPLDEIKLPFPEAAEMVAISPDGRLIAASYKQSIWVGDSSTGDLKRGLEAVSAVKALAFTPDSKSLVTSGEDGTVTCWNLVLGKPSWSKKGHEKEAGGIAVAPDGSVVATASQDSTVRLWNLRTGAEVRVITGELGSANSVAFSPDSKMIAVGHWNAIALWLVSESKATPQPKP